MLEDMPEIDERSHTQEGFTPGVDQEQYVGRLKDIIGEDAAREWFDERNERIEFLRERSRAKFGLGNEALRIQIRFK